MTDDMRAVFATLLGDEKAERDEYAYPRSELTFWSSDLKILGYRSTHRDLKFSRIKSTPGGFSASWPADDEVVIDYFYGQHRNTARPISVVTGGKRSLYMVTDFGPVFDGGKWWIEAIGLDVLQHLAALRLWPMPWLPAEAQLLQYWYGIGPAASVCGAAVEANLIRVQTGMYNMPTLKNPFRFLPDLGNALWPMIVNPRNKFIRDTSTWVTTTWRMDEALAATKEVADNENLQITYQFFVPWEDEQPFPEILKLDRPTVIFDWVEKGAPTGMTGTAVDGIIRTGIALAGDAMKWITYPILDTDTYDDYLNQILAKTGMLPNKPICLYTLDQYSPVNKASQRTFISTASRITAGGKSPDWMNALAVNGANLALGAIGQSIPGLGGLSLGVFEGLVKDKLFAFHTWEDPQREQTGGPMRFRETFAESASTGLSMNTMAGMKSAHWATRDYETHQIEVTNGSPYYFGRHFEEGDPIAVELPNKTIAISTVDQVDVEDSRSAQGKLTLSIGAPTPKEPGALALAKTRQTAQWLHRAVLAGD